MCLSIVITLSENDRINPDDINALLPSDVRVACRSQHSRKIRGGSVLSITEIGQGCACSLLSDAADWNNKYWEFKPEYLEGLTILIRLMRKHSSFGFSIQALWAGESPSEQIVISLKEFEKVTTQNRLKDERRIFT